MQLSKSDPVDAGIRKDPEAQPPGLPTRLEKDYSEAPPEPAAALFGSFSGWTMTPSN